MIWDVYPVGGPDLKVEIEPEVEKRHVYIDAPDQSRPMIWDILPVGGPVVTRATKERRRSRRSKKVRASKSQDSYILEKMKTQNKEGIVAAQVQLDDVEPPVSLGKWPLLQSKSSSELRSSFESRMEETRKSLEETSRKPLKGILKNTSVPRDLESLSQEDEVPSSDASKDTGAYFRSLPDVSTTDPLHNGVDHVTEAATLLLGGIEDDKTALTVQREEASVAKESNLPTATELDLKAQIQEKAKKVIEQELSAMMAEAEAAKSALEALKKELGATAFFREDTPEKSRWESRKRKPETSEKRQKKTEKSSVKAKIKSKPTRLAQADLHGLDQGKDHARIEPLDKEGTEVLELEMPSHEVAAVGLQQPNLPKKIEQGQHKAAMETIKQDDLTGQVAVETKAADTPLPAADTPLPAADTPLPAADTPLPAADTPLPAADTPLPAAFHETMQPEPETIRDESTAASDAKQEEVESSVPRQERMTRETDVNLDELVIKGSQEEEGGAEGDVTEPSASEQDKLTQTAESPDESGALKTQDILASTNEDESTTGAEAKQSEATKHSDEEKLATSVIEESKGAERCDSENQNLKPSIPQPWSLISTTVAPQTPTVFDSPVSHMMLLATQIPMASQALDTRMRTALESDTISTFLPYPETTAYTDRALTDLTSLLIPNTPTELMDSLTLSATPTETLSDPKRTDIPLSKKSPDTLTQTAQKSSDFRTDSEPRPQTDSDIPTRSQAKGKAKAGLGTSGAKLDLPPWSPWEPAMQADLGASLSSLRISEPETDAPRAPKTEAERLAAWESGRADYLGYSGLQLLFTF
ncbi:unnamed protein product [Darwinula stevensoni]|uniref:Uncharacterized protein n=1 Tax=Darwinula stevensoni TaxID=69355 RepID=A0A7R8X5R7_9CRUS|nr:unnamed protein product [Darwinula stevensoni]CAG0878862.1 unnamed protein product [Darwinula stevensoni]